MDETYIKDKEAIEAELMHYINSLIEPLANDSIVRSSLIKERAVDYIRNGKSTIKDEIVSSQAWVVGIDAIEDLKDIIRLLRREIDGEADSERYAVTILCDWDFIEKKLMPLWNLSSENMEIQALIIQILFLLTTPPDENWRKFHSKTMKCKLYQRNMQKIKFSLCSIKFWKEVLVLYKKLNNIIQNEGYVEGDREEIRKKEVSIKKLKKEDEQEKFENGNLLNNLDTECEENINIQKENEYKRLERLEAIRDLRDEIILINEKVEKRLKLYNNRIGAIKGLIIQTLKIKDPNMFDSINMFGVRSPHLILISKFIDSGILQIIEEDCIHYINSRSYSGFKETDSIVPWRILDYIYGLICGLQPTDFVNELFGEKKRELEIFKNNSIEKVILVKKNNSSGFTTNSLMNRHSRFNPILARKRIKELNCGIVNQVNNPKFTSSKKITKYRHEFDLDEAFEYIDIFIGAMQSTGGNLHCFEMYNFPTIEGTLGNLNGLNAKDFQETMQTLGEFLDKFFREKLSIILEDIFLIVRTSSEKYTIWDISRLISLMTWILAYKRSIFYQVTNNEKNADIIKDELTRLLLETKCMIDTKKYKAIDFIYSTIKYHARETLLKNKSHKIVRIALRCLNEQLKIIHLVSNSEVKTISDLGNSFIFHIAKLDIMNDISWILKHFVKTSHHPELILYAIEVSNRLIKLVDKIGGEAIVNIRRRKRDRITDDNDFNNDEEFYFNEEKPPGFNSNCYTENTKILSLEDMMNDFCDGRIVSNIMNLVNNYSSNHSNINWHIARLARKIITTHSSREVNETEDNNEFKKIYSGLFFQLSYFITFATILNDKGFLNSLDYDKGARDIVLLARNIIHQFWHVARINPFVFIELLFSKNSSRGLGLADPERLKSIFTNYEQGIDAAIVERIETTGSDLFEANSYIKSKISRERQNSSKWNKEDDEELLVLYNQYKNNPKCISIISGFLSNIKNERSIKKRLKELGKLFDEEKQADNKYNSCKNKVRNRELFFSIMNFKELCENDISEEFHPFDPEIVLKEQYSIFEEAYFTREVMLNHLDDVPLEIPSSLPNCLLMDSRYIALLKAIGLKQPSQQESLWIIPKEMDQENYLKYIDLFKELIEFDVFELSAMVTNFENQQSPNNSNFVEFNVKNLEEILQDFFENSELSCNISKVSEKGITKGNGLLNFISYELKLILSKNTQDVWENINLEDISICISQERLNQLGIKKEFAKIYESKLMNKLISLLGFKKSFISKDVQYFMNIERGINEEYNSENLFDEDVDREYADEIKSWILDYKNVSLKNFRERVAAFHDITEKLTSIQDNIVENYSRSNEFPESLLIKICENIFKYKSKVNSIENFEIIVQKLDALATKYPENDSQDYILHFNNIQDPNFKYTRKIINSLMGVNIEIKESFSWSIKPLFDKFTLEKVIEINCLLKKLIYLDISSLKQFVEKLIGRSLINRNEKRKINSKKRKTDLNLDKRLSDFTKDQFNIDEVSNISEKLVNEGYDKEWEYDWKQLENKMKNIKSSEFIDNDEFEIPGELFASDD